MIGSERESVFATVEDELAAGRRVALGTIVATTGSTYRHVGANLVVREDGTWVGSLSGGCLEPEVAAVGQRVMVTSKAEVVTFDLRADDEAIWGWGLGCNGSFDVLVEPSAAAAEVVEAVRRGAATGRPHVLATELPTEGNDHEGRHALILDDSEESMDTAWGDPLRLAAQQALAERRSQVVGVAPSNDAARVFLDVVIPPPRLVICGAGHDSVPVARYAAELGWPCAVVDDRSSFLDRDRFPAHAELIHARPGDVVQAARVDKFTYAVVMSHNFLRDVDYLAALLPAPIAYIGVLGPRRRFERVVEMLERTGKAPVRVRSTVHSPAGLDLGAEGAAEIAWAICAEILAVARGRPAGFLCDRGSVDVTV